MLYRIFTENKNLKGIEAICSKSFSGFTILKADGFWRLQREHSLIIEIVTEDPETRIKKLAADIKRVNRQETVLVQRIKNKQYYI